MKNPTLRRNGQRMVTVAVTHHLNRENMSYILAHEHIVFGEVFETKKQVEDTIRRYLLLQGTNYIYIAEEYDDGYTTGERREFYESCVKAWNYLGEKFNFDADEDHPWGDELDG